MFRAENEKKYALIAAICFAVYAIYQIVLIIQAANLINDYFYGTSSETIFKSAIVRLVI